MFMSRSEYDRGVNTFSPEGRLFQVEYAIETIKLGSTAIGLETKEGLVLAVEKRISSPLMLSTATEKIVEIDTHVGCAFSGLVADSKILIEKARVEAGNHLLFYNTKMPVESIIQTVSNLAIRFGDSSSEGYEMSRPFGVALLIAGIDSLGPQLYFMDPSGTYVRCEAKAIGSGCEGAQQALKDSYYKGIPTDEAIKLVLSILKQVMEEKLNSLNVEVATVQINPETNEPVYHLFDEKEVEEALKEIKL